MPVKAKDIKGFMMPNSRYEERAYNMALNEQGNRSVGLNREKLAELIYKNIAPNSAKAIGFENEKSGKNYFYAIADAIIAAEAKIIEYKEG